MRFANILVLGILLLSASGCVFFQEEAKPSKAHAIAVWQHQGDTWDIWYSLWDNDAKKWHAYGGNASAALAADPGDDQDPDISSNERTAMAVWSKSTGGNSIYYSVWDGNWSAPARLGEGDQEKDPAIAMEPSGNALSVWVHGHDTLMSSYYTAGKGWGAPQRIQAEMSNVTLPELAFNTREGLYYLIFTGNNGTMNGAYAAAFGPSAGWSGVELLANDSLLDGDTPTGLRTGIDSAEGRDEVMAVWPVGQGKVYSAIIGSKSPSELDRGTMPDTAYDSKDVAAGTYKKEGTVIFKRDVRSPGNSTSLSSLAGDDQRASLAFIMDRSVPMVVWWNRVLPPAQIFFSYFEGGKWHGPEEIDPSLVGTFNRNPSITDLGHRQAVTNALPSCGNGKFEFPWEQCESGKACPDAGFLCKDCECKEKPFYRISCASNSLESAAAGANSFDPDQFLCKDDCSGIDPGLACDSASCTCKRIFPEKQGNRSCALNTIAVRSGGGNNFSNATMICRDDCKLADISLSCDPLTCTCVEP